MTTKKVIVTGGAGYIGSHTCVELIKAGYDPIIIDNFSNSEKFVIERIEKLGGKPVQLIEVDCANESAILDALSNETNIVGLIHFAAFKAVGESTKLPLKYYNNNIGTTTAMLSLMAKLDCQSLVFSSSCTVYGQPDKLPVTEQSPIKPAESPYGRTKQICEDIIKDYYSAGAKVKVLALRYFNPIGAHPSALIGELPIGIPNNLVPFITQTASGQRKELTVFGDDYNTSDGTCIRDYIHVVDLAKAHVASIEYLNKQHHPLFDHVNIGTGRGNTVMEVIQTFEKVNNLKLSYKIGKRRAGDVEQVYADASYAKRLLGWKAEETLADSLVDSWKWEKSLNNQAKS